MAGVHAPSEKPYRLAIIGKPLLDSPRTGSEVAPTDHLCLVVERTVMAPDIPKIDTDRQLNRGRPARDFCDEVCVVFFMGISFSLPEDLLIPFLENVRRRK